MLGCGYNSALNRCRSALCDIIWHALLVDNKAARRKQTCSSNSKAWFTILTPTLTLMSTSIIEMNPIPASMLASTSKDAADVEAVSLKFDAQLSIGIIL